MNRPDNLNEREREVLAVFEEAPRPVTDRQVAQALRKSDPAYVRPSITRLLQREVLESHGAIIDTRTNRLVRRCAIAAHLLESGQAELF